MAVPAGKWRISLADLMIYVALAAIVLTPILDQNNPIRFPYYIPYAVMGCAMLAILVANRRLSPWIWVIIAAQLSNSLFALAKQVVTYDLLMPLSIHFEGWLSELLGVLGVGMMFRDIRRRLAALEGRAAMRPNDELPG